MTNHTTVFENRPFFRADARPDGTLELLCYEEIGEDSWTGAGVTAKLVKQQLDAAPQCSAIVLRINSPGGDVFEAIAVYNLLRAQKKPIEVRVDGLAASSASIIAMAGDTIVMGPNAMMMIHNAWSWCMGYASDMEEMAAQLRKISGVIAGTYARRTGRALGDVADLMDAETWMTADEAVAGGFATEIEPDPDSQVEAEALAIARRFRLLAKLKGVPDRFRASDDSCDCDCAACLDGDCDGCTNADCNDPNCVDCPMQGGGGDDLNDMQARLRDMDAVLKL